MPDFIPRQDTAAGAWAANFVDKCVQYAAQFSLPPEMVADLVQRQTDFAAALNRARDPATRTAAAISGKTEARRAFEQSARVAAGIVRARAARDRAMLTFFGLATGPGRHGPRRKIHKPQSSPTLVVRGVDGPRVTLRIHNPDRPSQRGMHADTRLAHLYTFVGDNVPADPAEWTYAGGVTKALKILDLGHQHPSGTQVWIQARFTNPRGHPGPIGTPVMAYLGYCQSTPQTVRQR